mmetsp:Transcript_295/g.661  ORF Transcript_295/g.661 Transcript_295/m.661 type:complete len:243 (+) Transcript_295:4841-5569(+)
MTNELHEFLVFPGWFFNDNLFDNGLGSGSGRLGSSGLARGRRGIPGRLAAGNRLFGRLFGGRRRRLGIRLGRRCLFGLAGCLCVLELLLLVLNSLEDHRGTRRRSWLWLLLLLFEFFRLCTPLGLLLPLLLQTLLLLLPLLELPLSHLLLGLLGGASASAAACESGLLFLLIDEMKQVVVCLFPIVISHQISETPLHGEGDTLVTPFALFVALGAVLDNALGLAVHGGILLFQVFDQDTSKH